MVRLLLISSFISLAQAYDEQLSLFTLASPFDIQGVGYGGELATEIGSRIVMGGEVSWADSSEDRPFQLNLNSRLLYSAGINAQWYPQASARWQPNDRDLSAWFGAGYQHKLMPAAGFMMDAVWQPNRSEFQVRFGVRLWLRQFQSLDSRVRASKPLGATYTAGPRPSSNRSAVKNVSVVAAPVSQELASISIEADSVTTNTPEEAPVFDATGALNLTDLPEAWYVHIGLFQLTRSIPELKDDDRLTGFQSDMITWYDSEVSGYRLLLGPYSIQESKRVSTQLKQAGVKNFLYQSKR